MKVILQYSVTVSCIYDSVMLISKLKPKPKTDISVLRDTFSLKLEFELFIKVIVCKHFV